MILTSEFAHFCQTQIRLVTLRKHKMTGVTSWGNVIGKKNEEEMLIYIHLNGKIYLVTLTELQYFFVNQWHVWLVTNRAPRTVVKTWVVNCINPHKSRPRKNLYHTGFAFRYSDRFYCNFSFLLQYAVRSQSFYCLFLKFTAFHNSIFFSSKSRLFSLIDHVQS